LTSALTHPSRGIRRERVIETVRSPSAALWTAAFALLWWAGNAFLEADFWWRYFEIQAWLVVLWPPLMAVVSARWARAFWLWLTATPSSFWPPWWVKGALLLAPLAVLIAGAIFSIDRLVVAASVLDGSEPAMKIQRRGDQLLLSGDINLGSAAKLETWLSVTPRPRELVLDSPGGFVLEARRIADLVEANGLDTRIDRECHSACVDIFAAGQIRTMRRGSVVGLHSAWSPVLTPEAGRAVAQANREFARRLYGRGIERRFLEVAIATPGSSMWVNSARQAHIAGLATRVVEQ
jgi:hypothetical protein